MTTSKPLQAPVRYLPKAAIIDLHGDIDGFSETPLNTAYDEAEAADLPAILLNFEGVGYINSKGIALIVSLLARSRAHGRKLLACGLSPHYVEIFEITRLSDFMHLYPDEGSAIEDTIDT